MTTHEIAQAIRRIYAELDPIRDALNAADRVMGDGDTGMTVANVVTAWYAALADEYPDASAMLQAMGRATRRATGSSLGSVMGIGLSAAGKSGAISAVDMLDAATRRSSIRLSRFERRSRAARIRSTRRSVRSTSSGRAKRRSAARASTARNRPDTTIRACSRRSCCCASRNRKEAR